MTALLKRLNWGAFLGRPSLSGVSEDDLDALAHLPVLISGACGSIGSALALRLAQLPLSALVLLDWQENNLYRLQQTWDRELQVRSAALTPATFVLADAGDRRALEEIFAVHQPRIVFHAAAYKHVPLLEQQPLAGVVNNVSVTAAIVSAAAEHGARVVLVSTDKAVAPVSVMGATKRVAEEIVLASGGTVLRLANVLASSGSVAEVFARQIAGGGPLTVSDPAARRYFLTLGEAAGLLLEAALNSASGPLAPALLADHSIVELAEFMARQLAPGQKIPIHFSGLHPGDKLTERLWDEDERVCSSGCANLLRVDPVRPDPMRFRRDLALLGAAARECDTSAVLAQLRALVPGYRPSQTVLALARKSAQRASA